MRPAHAHGEGWGLVVVVSWWWWWMDEMMGWRHDWLAIGRPTDRPTARSKRTIQAGMHALHTWRPYGPKGAPG